MERKRIKDINEIWDGNHLLINDFSNLDLSNIDLSVIPEGKWKRCTFCNTDLNNTNIKLFNENQIYLKIDYKTIMDNPNLKLPSIYIAAAISYYLSIDYGSYQNLRENEKSKIIFNCEEILKYDTQGYLKKFYNFIKDNTNLDEKYIFFAHHAVRNQYISNIYIDSDILKFISPYNFAKCSFENIVLDTSFFEILHCGHGDLLSDYFKQKNTYKNISMPKVGFSDWKSVWCGKSYLSTSLISFTTKIYLELSRMCNARCPFCRNQTFDNTKYDLNQIIATLHSLKYLIKTVVIGGGEPTLRINDVYRLITETKDIEWHLFSNATNKEILNEDFIVNNCKINISRHAVDEDQNSRIFNLKRNTIMTLDDIAKLNEKTEVTLNATCFKGGLDSYNKIMEYINISKKIGIKKVLIQNLQDNLSLGQIDFNYDALYFDDTLFDEIIARFNNNSLLHKRYPICSTSGYVTYIYKDDDGFQVAIQKYISEKELEKFWLTSIKRVYDLSIDPSGDLYENWGQRAGKVDIRSLKR